MYLQSMREARNHMGGELLSSLCWVTVGPSSQCQYHAWLSLTAAAAAAAVAASTAQNSQENLTQNIAQ